MPNDAISSNLILPIWIPDQLFELTENQGVSPETNFLPLNQRCCSAARMNISEYWPDWSYAQLQNIADQALKEWKPDSSTSSVMCDSTMWRASREAAYITRAIENCVNARGLKAPELGVVVPFPLKSPSVEGLMEILPFFVLRDFARARGYTFHTFFAATPPTKLRSENPELKIPRDMRIDNCVLTYGVPDLSKIVAEYASKPTNTMFIATPDCEAHIDPMRSITQRYNNVQFHILGRGTNAAGPTRNTERTGSAAIQNPAIFGSVAPYFLNGFCAHVIKQYGDSTKSLATELADIVTEMKPAQIAVANHDSIFTKSILEAAKSTKSKVELFEHSLWPLPKTPFEVSIPEQLIVRHTFYIQSAKRYSKTSQRVNSTRILRRWSTLNINKNRVLFSRAKRKVSERIFGPTIGLIVTSGQILSAPDIHPQKLLSEIAKLCKAIFSQNSRARILLRLRDAQDDAALISNYVKNEVDQRFWHRISVSAQSDHQFQEFAQRCHKLVEVGTPTSASFEAFALQIPLYRISVKEWDSLRFVGRPVGSIDAKGSDFNHDVEQLMRLNQSALIKTQFAYLKKETSQDADLAI